MPASRKSKIAAKTSRSRRKSDSLLMRVTRPVSSRFSAVFVAVFVLVGGYALYAASHAAGTPEIALARAGLCLDDYRNQTANGSPIDVWTCNGSAAQHWVMSGKYIKVNGKCLDASGWGTANGTKIILYTCHGSANQQWVWRSVAHGRELVNVHANKCLDDTAFGNSGTKVVLWTCTGGSNQLWHTAFYNPPVSAPSPSPSATQPAPSPSSSPSPTSGPSAACTTPSTDNGTDTMSVSIPADANYTVWVRMLAPDTSSNSLDLQVDEAACFHMGGSSSISTGSLTWVDYQVGSAGTTPARLTLTAGSHTLKLIGTHAGVGVDRVILTSDTTCVPSGNGDNCLSSSGSVTPTPTSTPTPSTSTSPTAATCPSPKPTAPVNGYTISACEDFNNGLGAFGPYNGGGGSTVVGAGRVPSQCVVAGGVLELKQASNGATCGGSMLNFSQKYGYWEVKMRAYYTGTSSGSAPHPVLILWPDSNTKTSELDYFETNLGDPAHGFLHCISNPSKNCFVIPNSQIDYSQWHVYGLLWTPTSMTGYIDGQLWWTVTGSVFSSANPPDSSHQTIQLDNLSGSTPVRPGEMDIDWAHMYK